MSERMQPRMGGRGRGLCATPSGIATKVTATQGVGAREIVPSGIAT